MHNFSNHSAVKKVAVLTSAAAVAFAGVAVSHTATAAVYAPNAGSPAEFILDLDGRGMPFAVGGYTNAMGFQHYQIMNIEGTTVSDADAGYPGHDLIVDFQGDSSDWWFSPDGWGDQGTDLQGFMYDAAAPAGSKYAYFVLETSNTGTRASYIGRVDNNGVFSIVAHVDRPSGTAHSDHEWTMLSNGDLVLFDSPTRKLLNYGNLRSLTENYTHDTKNNSPTLTIQSETQAGQEMTEPTFDSAGSILQTAVIDVDGVEYVLVIDSDSPPSYGIHLFNASTLAYVGELDPAGSTGVEGEANAWTTASGPQVEATASIGGDAYLVYSTPDTVGSFSPVAGRYAMGKITEANIDLNAMTVDVTSHLTDVEMKNRVSLGIQAPAAAQTFNLPPELPAISHLVYDANDGQQDTAPDTQTDETSTDVLINSGTPTYDGYLFAGWNTSTDGTGTGYAAGEGYTLPGTAGAVDTVYAQWSQTPGTASCSSGPTGLIQAIKGLEGDDIVSFKLLDLDAGDYVDMDPAVSLDLAALGFAGAGGFNATAIDKATGKMFATINDGADLWLVQFDLEPTPNVAFLGKVQHPGTEGGFSGTVTSDGTYVMNYYITGLVEIPNVSSLTTYGSPEAASGVTLGTVHETNVFGWHGDLASITLSDNSEYVVGYNPGTNKVVLAPVDDLSNPVVYTTTFPSSFTTSGENLGASWSTGDTVYFSRNDGEGVFAVSAADINVETQETIMRATSVTSTVSTSSNDGFGCVPAAEAPEAILPQTSSPLACAAWPGLIWVQNQSGTPTNDYQAANTSQFFMFDPGSGDLDADGLNDASTWVYDDTALGYDIAINATGVDPTSNIMFGTANVDGVAYVASFAPGQSPVFHSKDRVDGNGASISNTANGFVDAEGHYWIKDSSGPLYRSQQPMSSYEGFADYNVVTAPMVFDAIGSGNFGSVSDIAVVPIADGYLAVGFLWNTLYWGTWNSTTNTWTSGTNASVSTGTASPGDYGAVFVDGVASDGGTLDYSGASIYFTPNAGWDPDNAAGRRPVKLAVADALDGITSDDLVLLESTPTPVTGSNDGASMAGCGLQLPDPLGGLHGWMWADIDGDGSRTAVEPTDGMFGDEAVITGYTATVISETNWTTLQGVVAVPAGTRYPATVDADGKWSVDGLAAGADPTGVLQTFKVEFDYTGATMPTDFSPEGYTVKGGSTGTDSDVPVTAGATATSIGGFTVSADSSSHAADAGITTPLPALPVVFEEQGGSEVGDLTCELGGSFTVPAAPTRDGYTFAGWNSAADGTGTSYVIGQDYDCADL
ncbi:MAG: InlB B-repeat-containing protein, partial [Ilumatobacteraceae bacterium]|nr:InlB B-repeat-containing protein [Ilumatobacteraceae bacterium]